MLLKGFNESDRPPKNILVENDLDFSTKLRQVINAKVSEVSTVSNSVGFDLQANKLLVWFNEPNQIIVNNDLVQKIEQIIRFALFPYYTVLPSKGINIVDRGEKYADNRAALKFKLHRGTFDRLVYNSLGSCSTLDESEPPKKLIPLESGLSLDLNAGSGHIALAGRSGNGKTALIIVLASSFLAWIGRGMNQNNDDVITIIDPKADNSLYHFAKHAHVNYVSPRLGANTSLFFDTAIQELKKGVDLMTLRYEEQKRGRTEPFTDAFFIIDEAYGLVNMSNSTKALKEYHQLINTLTLQARAVNIHLLIASQTLPVGSGSDSALTSAARDQLSTRIILSQRPTKEDCRFLMKSLDNPEDILIEHDSFDVGYGLIEMPDGQVYPLKTPYIKDFSSIFNDEEADANED